jgi:hypothetical protein
MHWLLIFLATAFLNVARGAERQPAAAALQDIAQNGVPLTTGLTVNGNVSIETVLLPPRVTRGIFGKAVSDRYAAVELIVSNRSHDAALVVHSVSLDYSQWLLSGAANSGNVNSWQTASRANQIGATEYRIPRGQLLDAQQWSARNITLRSLETLGSLASGYVFAFKEVGIAKGVAAYNGSILPSLRTLLPDSAIDQANRISDLGYRVNKVIPQESSDIMVAFFPLDRFLTPGLSKLFQKSPAIFFLPQAAAFDPKTATLLRGALQRLGVTDLELRRELLAALQTGTPNATTRLLDSLSLNRLRIVVGGVMTVNVDTVPARIESVEFDQTDWAQAGVKKGTIHGNYLSKGTLAIAEASRLGITDVATMQDGNDQTLSFQFNTTVPVAPGAKLTFRVDKAGQAQKPVAGTTFEFAVDR